jgi:hypothetical protein
VGNPPQLGDVVFYFDEMDFPTHVGQIGSDGLVISKFHNDPKVYKH